jgi:hypothetical protein
VPGGSSDASSPFFLPLINSSPSFSNPFSCIAEVLLHAVADIFSSILPPPSLSFAFLPKQRWKALSKAKQPVKGPWTPAEDANLRSMVERYGSEKWVRQISSFFCAVENDVLTFSFLLFPLPPFYPLSVSTPPVSCRS